MKMKTLSYKGKISISIAVPDNTEPTLLEVIEAMENNVDIVINYNHRHFVDNGPFIESVNLISDSIKKSRGQ